MPRKKGVRRKQVTLGLSDFLGPEAQKDALPTAPSGRSDEGGRYGRGRGGGGGYDRYRRDDRPPSKADVGDWRNVGRSSGGGFGGSRFGGSQDSRFGGGGRGGVSTNNRFDRGGASHNPWRSSQDARSGDTRPAYLRNRFKKEADQSAKEEEERKARAKKIAQDKKKKADVEAETRQNIRDARATTYAANLIEVKTVEFSNAKTPLETAVVDLKAISEDSLLDSFQRLDLGKLETVDVGIVLANSIVDAKFTLDTLIGSLQTNVDSDKDKSTIVAAVMKNLQSKGNRTLTKVLADSDRKEILATVNPGLSGEEFEKFLVDEELAFLKPLPDVAPEVTAALESGASPTEVLALINAKLKPTEIPVALAPVVTSFVLGKVFVSKSKLNLDVITEYAPVLLRCESNLDSEMAVLFATQFAWKKAGQQRKFICPLFKQLYEAKVVSWDALDGWRNDRTKSNSKGKAMALLGTNNWITEIAPPPEEEDEEEDDEEEEQFDDHLRRPDNNFF